MNQLKNLALTIVALCLFTISFGQSKENPNTIRIAGGVHDSYGPFEGQNFPFGIWNTDNLDKAFQLQYMRWKSDFVDIGANVTAASLKNMYDEDFMMNPLAEGSSIDLDLLAKYKFYNGVDFNTDALIQPYIYTGLSGTYISALENVRTVDNGFAANVPLGTGFRAKFSEKVQLDLSGAFRVGLFDKIPNRWEYMAGLGFNFGPPIEDETEPVIVMPEPKDSDNDGIVDVDDDCPNEPGVASNNGCPEPADADGDGVVDEEDDCPEVAGTLNGCPDSDGDGIADSEDDCPEQAGSADTNGCPADSDGDGISDDEDDCPTVAGVIEMNGCPPPADSDGDGVPDNADDCPAVPGVVSLNGCPEEVEEEVVQQIEDISRNIFFELDSFNLRQDSRDKLDELLSIMDDYSNFSLKIEGHTDSSGQDSYNQSLSEKRAGAVRDYLLSRGVDAARVTSAGYGESRPIADNSTSDGRAQNRRVELHLELIK